MAWLGLCTLFYAVLPKPLCPSPLQSQSQAKQSMNAFQCYYERHLDIVVQFCLAGYLSPGSCPLLFFWGFFNVVGWIQSAELESSTFALVVLWFCLLISRANFSSIACRHFPCGKLCSESTPSSSRPHLVTADSCSFPVDFPRFT